MPCGALQDASPCEMPEIWPSDALHLFVGCLAVHCKMPRLARCLKACLQMPHISVWDALRGAAKCLALRDAWRLAFRCPTSLCRMPCGAPQDASRCEMREGLPSDAPHLCVGCLAVHCKMPRLARCLKACLQMPYISVWDALRGAARCLALRDA